MTKARLFIFSFFTVKGFCEEKIECLFFFSNHCKECIELKEYFFPNIEEKFSGLINIKFLESDQNIDNYLMLVSIAEKRSKKTVIPSMYVGNILLVGKNEIESKLERWITETDLSSEENVYPWTGSIKLSRAIYILRNTQHHLSEMSLELTRRGYKSPEWQ